MSNNVNLAKKMKNLADYHNSLGVILHHIHSDIKDFSMSGLYEMEIGKDYCHKFLQRNQCNYIVSNPDFAKTLKFKLEQEGFEVIHKDTFYNNEKVLLIKIKWQQPGNKSNI